MARQQDRSTSIERPRNGARGALLDEYERAIQELKRVIADVDEASLAVELYPDEADPNCRGIGTILEHVVRAGYRDRSLLSVAVAPGRGQAGRQWLSRDGKHAVRRGREVLPRAAREARCQP